MQKIGSSTTTADENGEFTDGDPQREISCTWVMAAWLNTLQRELVHLCEEAGIPLDPADDTQVYKAISALLNDGVKGMVKSVNTHKPNADGEVTLPDASTTGKGLAELSSATNSTSETLAATPKAVKAVQDAVSALDKLTVKTVNTHKPDTAGNVKLGTAADADVQTSVADLTVGHVLTVGKAFGLGLARTDQTALSLMRSTSGYTGFTWSANNDPEAPSFLSAHASIGIQNQIWKDSSGQNYVLQTAWRDGKIGFRTVEANTVGPWCEYFHTKNLPTATQTGALPLTGGTMTGEIKSTSANAVRMIQGGYGVILRMDANGFYILQTNKDDSNGNHNANRSVTIANDTGAVGIGTALSVDSLDFIRKTGINAYSNGGHNFNQTNGMRLQGLGDQMAEMYLLEQVGDRTVLGFHIAGGGNEQWIELHATGEFTVNGSDIAPVGIPQPWPQENPPPGWLICNGAGFNTSLFPLLLKAYPNGVLPDLRGVFLRGKDNGRGIDPNRNLGELQWSQNASHTHGYTAFRSGVNQWHISLDDSKFGYSDEQTAPSGGSESRPTNVSVNYIVRAA